MKIKKFTFNSFQENTYVIDSQNQCMIVDPGCQNEIEEKILTNYIENENLVPVQLINTHCHIDHIFGNKFISKKYNLKAKIHKLDFPLLENAKIIANHYGVPFSLSNLENNHKFGVFEIGMSKKGEINNLSKVVVCTNSQLS